MVAEEPLLGLTPDTLFEEITVQDHVTLGVVLVILIEAVL
jgi:hypothetical protein